MSMNCRSNAAQTIKQATVLHKEGMQSDSQNYIWLGRRTTHKHSVVEPYG